MSDQTKLCFIVGPIGSEGSEARKHSDFLLRFVIQPVMAQWQEFTVQRADQIATPGMIDRQIITRLRDADLVIADLATLNPNAFYEIGIRHMVSKPIIHMQQLTESIPFDVSLYSAVKYSLDSVQSIDRAVGDLTEHVKGCLDPNHEVDNPVTRVLGQVQLNQNAMPEIQLLRAELESLRNAVAPVVHEHSKRATKIVQAAMRRAPSASNAISETLRSILVKQEPSLGDQFNPDDAQTPLERWALATARSKLDEEL